MKQHPPFHGLTDEQVRASRATYGKNILTPPPATPVWERLKHCFHFWLVRTYFVIFIIAALVAFGFPLAGIYSHDGLWIAPALSVVLFAVTTLVAYLSGDWNAQERTFRLDPLMTILLFVLLLSGAIAFYNGAFGNAEGWQPYLELIGIAMAVLLATSVAHALETANEKAFRSLNEVNDEALVKVLRNDNVTEVPQKDVVVGDIVLLEFGDEVPADAELIESEGLIVDESSFTGEILCPKSADPDDFDRNATYPSNVILKGCILVDGACTARITAVGDASACGKLLEAAQVKDDEPTPLDKKLNRLASLIAKTSYILAIIVVFVRLVWYALVQEQVYLFYLIAYPATLLLMALIIGGIIDQLSIKRKFQPITLWKTLLCMVLPTLGTLFYFLTNVIPIEQIPHFVQYALNSVMIAIALIAVAVPEGLPMAVTLSLAFSMKRLMKQNTLPRTMHSCETMGAVSVICSDKTGTLTQNQMRVVDTFFPALEEQRLGDDRVSELLKDSIAVNTTAHLDCAEAGKMKPIGNPTEGALLLWLHNNKVDYTERRESANVVDRLLFSNDNKYMATLVESGDDGRCILYVKGAPDILMRLCRIDDNARTQYETRLAEYQNRANRTLALAYKEINDGEKVFRNYHLIVSELTLLGIVAIEDPVRNDVPEAINECLNAGIQVKIVTGDAAGTAREIGRRLGLWTPDDTDEALLDGPELASLTDDGLVERLPHVKIIARAHPDDKERVVHLLRECGEVVAVTGDGSNDAPALNAANVGLSMGDGTAVAKEASDMTIIDNSFRTIANAVMWGRSLYKNIKRFILFQMTVNVAACLTVAIGAFLGTDAPLTVTQMLWVNLIMDTFAALALASLPPSRSVMGERPRAVDESILKGMGTGILGVGITFTILLLGICFYLQKADIHCLADILRCPFDLGNRNSLSPYEQSLFFTIFVMLQFWNLFNAKAFMTGRSAIFHGLAYWRQRKLFLTIVAVILGGQVLLTELPGLQEMFNVAPGGVKFADWLIIFAATSIVLWIGEIIRFKPQPRPQQQEREP